MKTGFALALSSCLLGAACFVTEPAHAADNAAPAANSPADTGTGDAPCGKLVGPGSSGSVDAGFALRDGEAVDFVSGGQTTHGKLLVFSEGGSLFRAYWQPQGSEEKYALANAGPRGVRLISTPPQGTEATDGKPGITTQPLQVMSCPKL